MKNEDFLSWIPGWIGFLALILVGVSMTLNGAINQNLDTPNQAGFIVFGLCAVVIGVFSWVIGGTSRITGRVGRVGVLVKIQDLPWYAHLVNASVLGLSAVLFFVLK